MAPASLRITDRLLCPLRRVASNVRLQPFDSSTPEGRARERVRKAGLTALTAAVARAIAMLTPLVSMPLTLKYLGLERYGMWQTIVSVVGMMAFADLGLGCGLLTAVAQASGRDDKQDAERLVSSAFFVLTAAAGLLLIGFLAVSPLVPWSRVFNVTSLLAKNEAGASMVAFTLCFGLSLPLGLVQKVQSGYQEGFQSNLWQCLASILTLAALVAAIHARVGLPLLALVIAAVPLLVLALNSIVYFGYQRPWLRPRWRHFHGPTGRDLLRTGLSFLTITILMAIGISADNLVVAQILGAEAVTQLAVPARLVAPLSGVAMMLFLPMWSANGEAIARGDVAWVGKTARRLTALTFSLVGCGVIAYVLLGPLVIHSLVGNRVAADRVLLLGLGAFTVMQAAGGPAFMVLNSMKLLGIQIVMYSAFTAVGIVAKVLLARRFGITAIPWAGAASYALLVLLPLWIYVPRVLDRLERRPKP